ncbi:MAG: hypothetical protein V1885_03525 [Candidatus Brennerbacteria bacterium]
MTLSRIHVFAWISAALTAAFVFELSGAFRIGAAGVYVALLVILLAGFFSVRWFAGFLAFLLLVLSFLVAPFWVLETGAVALLAIFLLIVAPFLTGNRFYDFLILVGGGACAIAVFGGAVHGGVSLQTVVLTLIMNLAVGAGLFLIVERNSGKASTFAL